MQKIEANGDLGQGWLTLNSLEKGKGEEKLYKFNQFKRKLFYNFV
jgi:hypothetical protein